MLIQGYRDVSIARSGMRTDCEGSPYWGASFKLDGEVRALFPYINAAVEGARYTLRPHSIQFNHEGVRCTLYPSDAVAAPFSDRDHVFSFIENLVLFLNDLDLRREALTPNHQVARQPTSILEILKTLPRTNCGDCGYTTCTAFAAALSKAAAAPEGCPSFCEPLSTSKVYPVIGPDGTVLSTFTIETGQDRGAEDSGLPSDSGPAASDQHRPSSDHITEFRQKLTSREIQVLRLVAEGASNPEISRQLQISPHTVKSHIIHIFNKLGVNDRTQAAVWAVQNDML